METITYKSFEAGLDACEAIVTAVVPRGCGLESDAPSVVLSERILIPESVTRSGDSGSMDSARVIGVHRGWDGQLYHRLPIDAECPSPGQRVTVCVDATRRQRIRWTVCAGRLIQQLAVAGWCGTEMVDAHFCVDAARVEFGAAEVLPEPHEFAEWLNERVHEAVSHGLRVTAQAAEPGNVRRVQIGDGSPFLCDGPYPVSVGLLRRVTIGPVFVRGGRLIVRYSDPVTA